MEQVHYLDYTGFQEFEPDFVLELFDVGLAGLEYDLEGEQWAGAFSVLAPEDIYDLELEFINNAIHDFEATDFLGIPDEQALALFESTFFEFEGAPNALDDGEAPLFDPEVFAANLDEFGGLLDGFLGAIGPGQYDDLGGDVIFEVLQGIDLGAPDYDATVFGGDDISGAIAVLNEFQIDELGIVYISDALEHIAITDFDWTGDVALNVIGLVGLEDVLGSEDAEGIFGSFDLASADLLAETLGDNLNDVIAELDFVLYADLLDGSAFLDATDPTAFLGLEVNDIAGLFNSGEDIFQVDEDSLSAGLDALLNGGGLDQLTDDAVGGGFAGLSGDIIFEILNDVADAAIALDILDADLIGSGGEGFDGIVGVSTVFDQVDFEAPELLLDLIGGDVAVALFGAFFPPELG